MRCQWDLPFVPANNILLSRMARATYGLVRRGGFGPFDQLFVQLIRFEQLNRHLYDSDLVGQTGKVGQKVSIF